MGCCEQFAGAAYLRGSQWIGRRGRSVRLALLALSTVLTAGAGPRAADAERSVTADGSQIELSAASEISAYRGVLAMADQRPYRCGSIRLWSPSGGLGGSVAAGCSRAGGYNEIASVALGANLLVWIFSWGDLDAGSDCLIIRRVHSLKLGASVRRRDHACNVDYSGEGPRAPAFDSVANGGTRGAEGKRLTFLAPVAGGVVYSRSAYCNNYVYCSTPKTVPLHTEATFLVSQAGKRTRVAGRYVDVVTAGGSFVAARRGSKSLDLLNLKTRKWRRLLTGEVRTARFDGETVFVLRPEGLLETYDVRSARRIAVQTLMAATRSAPQLEDVDEGIVVYLAGGEIHIRRSSDQRDSTVPLPSDAVGPIHAQMESIGLYFSYNRAGPKQRGTVAFIPKSALFH
jgi:hypothetical protein